MVPTIYKPCAYKTPGIYNGAGGIYKGRGVYKDGAQEFVEIGGKKYLVANINGKKWICQNLDYINTGIILNNNNNPQNVSNDPNAWYFNKDVDDKKNFGLFYNFEAVEYLEQNKNEFFPGWHVATESDYNDLLTFVNNDRNLICSKEWGGIDKYNFNLLPNGICGAFWFEYYGTVAEFWGINCDVHADINTIAVYPIANKYVGRGVRLVKDV